MNRVIKMRWARKLMQAKYFVLLTDSEAVIALDGVEPELMLDAISLEAQSAELKEFRRRIDILIKDHNRALANFRKVTRSKRATTNRKKTPKANGPKQPQRLLRTRKSKKI